MYPKIVMCLLALVWAPAWAEEEKPLYIPKALGTAGTYQEELLEAYVRVNFAYTGEHGRSVWNGIKNFPAFFWFEFLDARTMKKVKLFVNDEIKLVFLADGSSLRVKFIGPFAPSGLFFQVIHGTERGPDGELLATRNPRDPSSGVRYEHPGTVGRIQAGGPTMMVHYQVTKPYNPYDPANWRAQPWSW